MAVGKKVIKAIKDLLGFKSSANNRFRRQKEIENSAHFDVVNQDIVNTAQEKKDVKGQKKFWEFVEVALEWINRSLYWIQRSSATKVISQPSPTNYNNYALQARQGKVLSKKQLQQINLQKSQQRKEIRRLSFKQNLYREEQSNLQERMKIARQRQTFIELIQARQNEGDSRSL